MSVTAANHQNRIPSAYEGNVKNSVCKTGQEETEKFEMPFLGTESDPPSFVGKVYTREGLLQSVEEQVGRIRVKKCRWRI